MNKKMIQINKITENWADVYQDGQLIGRTDNYLEFNDIRLQVKKDKIEGVYLITQNNERVDIDKNGKCDFWPRGFFDLIENQLFALL